MHDAFQSCFARLETLSTDDLDRSILALVRAENRNAADVIAHLAEISRRKAALERGYPSLFEYCVRRLGLSEGCTALRIQVANVARRFPQLLAALAEGRISLTVAGRLAPHMREENSAKLLSDCAGMTKRAVEEYLVQASPRPVVTPAIRKRPDAKETGRPAGEQPPPPLSAPAQSPPPARVEPAKPEVFNFRFASGAAFKQKLLRLAEVLGIDAAERNMAQVLERALDLALDAKDPGRRHERRLERAQRRNEVINEPRPDEDVAPATSRHVPLAARDRVLERAGHQCQFTGPTGMRCTARTGLEIEHARPFAIFRSHDERFLDALCPRHNRLRAERTFGAEHIRRKVEERRHPLCPRRPSG